MLKKFLFSVGLLLLPSLAYADVPYQGNQPYAASTGVGANVPQSIAIPIIQNRAFYLTSVSIYGTGATVGTEVICTVTNTAAIVVTNLLVNVPAGALASATGVVEKFSGGPLFSGGNSTSFTIACPAFGTGNTNQVINVSGYYY